MSLSEAMLDLAKEMEEKADKLPGNSSQVYLDPDLIRGWAKQIRRMCESAKSAQPEGKPYDVNADLAARFANPSDLALAQRAADRVHNRQKIITSLEEMANPRFACCADGPEQGTSIDIHPGAGPGFKTRVAGHLYELQADGKLRVCAEEGK